MSFFRRIFRAVRNLFTRTPKTTVDETGRKTIDADFTDANTPSLLTRIFRVVTFPIRLVGHVLKAVSVVVAVVTEVPIVGIATVFANIPLVGWPVALVLAIVAIALIVALAPVYLLGWAMTLLGSNPAKRTRWSDLVDMAQDFVDNGPEAFASRFDSFGERFASRFDDEADGFTDAFSGDYNEPVWAR